MINNQHAYSCIEEHKIILAEKLPCSTYHLITTDKNIQLNCAHITFTTLEIFFTFCEKVHKYRQVWLNIECSYALNSPDYFTINRTNFVYK